MGFMITRSTVVSHAEMFAEIKLTATTLVERHLLVAFSSSGIQKNLNYYHPGTQAAGGQAICKIAQLLADIEFTTR
jgi:hypothetical protein